MINTLKEEITSKNNEYQNQIGKLGQMKDDQASTQELLKEYIKLSDLYSRREVITNEILKNLKGDFFKNAKPTRKGPEGINDLYNYAIMTNENEEFYVLVSTSKDNEVIIARDERLKRVNTFAVEYFDILKARYNDFLDEWSKNKEKGEVTYKLIDLYSKLDRNQPANIFYYLKHKKDTSKINALAKKCYEKLLEAEQEIHKLDEDTQEDDEKRKRTNIFIHDVLEDLEDFKKAGWRINYHNIIQDELFNLIDKVEML